MRPTASAMSVMTAPADTKKSNEPASNATASAASRRERSASQFQASQATTPPPSQCGSRAARSLTPKSWKLPAVIQNESGGLPQNGSPGAIQGVTQSPCTNIWRAISA